MGWPSHVPLGTPGTAVLDIICCFSKGLRLRARGRRVWSILRCESKPAPRQRTPPASRCTRLAMASSAAPASSETTAISRYCARHGRQVPRVEAACDQSSEQQAPRRREEPQSHHLADETRGRELGDRTEPHRTQAQLAEAVQQVGQQQPLRARELAAGDDARGSHHHQETEPEQQQAEREFRRCRRIEVAAPEIYPERRKRRCEQQDVERSLEPGTSLPEPRTCRPSGR